MIHKLGWQKIAIGAMALLVLIIFGFVALKFANTSASKTSPDVATTNATPTVHATIALALPTITSDPHVNNPVYGVVVSKSLNIRSGPSTDASVVGSLKLGDIITLVKRDSAWYQTKSGGWVSALYIEVRQTLIEAQAYSAELTH